MAKLSCMVTNLGTYESLSITWTRQNGEVLKTHTSISESHPNATFTAIGETTVCVEDWESGDEFTCTVAHTDLPSPLKPTISRPNGRPCPAASACALHGLGDGDAQGRPSRACAPDQSSLLSLLPQSWPSTYPPCTCCHQPGSS